MSITGRSQVGFDSLSCQAVINILKCWSTGYTGGATPALIDANGYPCAPFTGDFGGQINGIGTSGTVPLSSTGPWVFSWPATRSKFRITFNSACTVDGLKTVGTPTISGGVNNNLTITGPGNGTAGSVTFTFTSLPSGLDVRLNGNSGAQAWDAAGTGDWTLMREDQVSRYNSGEILAQACVDFYAALNPKTLRMMNVVNTGSGNACSLVKWEYQNSLASLSWSSAYYASEAWAGDTTGTDDLSVGTWSSMASSSAWTANEPFFINLTIATTANISITGAANNGSGLIRLTVSSTAALSTGNQALVGGINGTVPASGVWTITVIDGTHIDLQGSAFSGSGTTTGKVGIQKLTVSGTTKGTKFIVGAHGGPIGSDFTSSTRAAGLYQCHYDADLDRAILTSVNSSLPISVQVAIANRLNCNLGVTVPHMADDNFVSHQTQYVHDNLTLGLKGRFEVGNELWNTAFFAAVYAIYKAAALGLTTGSANSWYGLRVKQLLGNIVGPIWADRASDLERVMGVQVVTSQGSGLTSYRLAGAELGAYGFNTKPNRPEDCIEVLSYAPYGCGASLGNTSDAPTVPNSDNAAWLQALIDAKDAGNTSSTRALIDDDMRRGRSGVQTVTASGTTFTTPNDHGFTTSRNVSFQVTGGTMYSGIADGRLYRIASVPTTKTFTIQGFTNGVNTGSAVNAGSVGTGTVTVGFNGNSGGNANTLLQIANTYHLYWESIAASIDADRPATPDAQNRWSARSVVMHLYEACHEIGPPSSAQCTSLGLTSANGADTVAAAAVLDYKNSPYAGELFRSYYRQFHGTDPNSITYGLMLHAGEPSNLNVFGGSIWALTPNFNLPGTPYDLYDGVANFNNRKRSISW